VSISLILIYTSAKKLSFQSTKRMFVVPPSGYIN
jgi:hypothetical protein